MNALPACFLIFNRVGLILHYLSYYYLTAMQSGLKYASNLKYGFFYARCVILIGLLISTFILHAQQINFKQYTVADGLCQNTVWCVYQDSKGFMWFGTKDGLNRFDGITFKSYKNNPFGKNTLGNVFIRSIMEYDKNSLWIGTDEGIYVYDYIREEFHRFKIHAPGNVPITTPVNSLIRASDGTIWIATLGQGAFNFQPPKNRLIQYKNSADISTSLSNDFVSDVYETKDGSIWVSTLGGGLNQILKLDKKIVRYVHDRNVPGSITDNSVFVAYEDSQYNLWIGTENGGLNMLDRARGIFTSYQSKGLAGDISSNTVRQIFESKPGELLIGTEKGLNVLNIDKRKFTVYQNQKNDYKSISDNAIYSIFRDKEGGIWVGTYFGGVNYIAKSNKQVEHYYPTGELASLSGRAVSAFLEDSKGRFWVGTEDGGLNLFDKRERSFTKILPGTNYQNIHDLAEDKNGTIWIGTFLTGLVNYNPETRAYKNYLHNENNPNTLSNNSAFSVYKDNEGMIWVGTISGLNIYHPETDSFTRLNQLGLDRFYTYDILQDSKGNMWFATYGNGVICYNKKQNKWKQYAYAETDKNSLSNNKVIVIYEDSKQRLWFGTEGGGLNLFNSVSDKIVRKGYNDGITSNVIFGILEDNYGYLWISTNNGLLKYDPAKKTTNVYGDKDDFQGTQFNYKSFYKRADGKMYFGGINGFNAFYPENILKNNFIPPVKIVNFQLFNKDVTVGPNSPLQKTISQTSSIRLAYDQSVIGFEFVALSYTAPTKNYYSYMLEGFDKEWLSSGSQRKVTYTNLPPGKYTFKVKAASSDGVWNTKGTSLQLIITPPWWQTLTAYIIYGLLIIIIFFISRRYILRSIHRKHQHRTEAARVEKEKNFYNQKIEFFTTIAHEIRTPLSLIIGPLENVMAEYEVEPDMQDQLELMDKNSKRLLNLVNQLLDFRKVEERRYNLSTERTEVIQLIRTIYSRFNVNSSKKTHITLDSEMASFFSWVDVEVLTKVLSNLLFNAIKFTNSNVTVSIDEIKMVELPVDGKTHPCIIIHVSDDGDGISPEQINNIFEPYLQLSDSGNNGIPGTGIGLALARSLTELHNGVLSVVSQLGKGSTFSVTIPVMLENTIIDTLSSDIFKQDTRAVSTAIEKQENQAVEVKANTSKATILIVEDNVEVLGFLKQSFDKHNYHVFTAPNGEAALVKLNQYEIDLVLSDVMMPNMDGFELCKRIKDNVETSHIPVVLISAKSGSESVVEGFELGADAYLSKPFSMKQVQLQVNNIIQSRRLLRKKFNNPFSQPKDLSYNKNDQKFLENITKVIEEHLLVTNFGVEELSREIGISRSGLHKKLKVMIGLGPNELIRSVRLKHAAQMILKHEYNLSEVAYNTGFSSPSYFTKCFTKEFGVNPKEFTLEHLTSQTAEISEGDQL